MRLLPMISVFHTLQEVWPFQHAALELFKFIYVRNSILNEVIPLCIVSIYSLY